MGTRAGMGAAVSLTVGLALLFTLWPNRRPFGEAPNPATPSSRQVGSTQAVPTGTPRADHARDPLSRRRAPLRGTVRLTSGEPVPHGQVVRVRPLGLGPSKQRSWWTLPGPQALTRYPIEAGSYPMGVRASLPPTTLLIASSTGTSPVAQLHTADAPPPDFVLAPVAPLRVRLVDETGRPVPGANLTHSLLLETPGGAYTHAEQHTSTPTGEVTVPAHGGLSALVVRTEGLGQALWLGSLQDAPRPLTITLRARFAAQGRVLGAPSMAALEQCELHLRGPGQDWRERLAVRRLGGAEFDFDDLPFLGPGEYILRLQGEGLQPIEQRVQVEAAGQRVGCDFEWATGTGVRVVAFDPDGVPQADVEVVAIWQAQDQWLRYVTRTGDDGRALFEQCADSSIWVRSYAPGFVDERWGPISVSTLTTDELELWLDRAGRVRGRVEHRGQPVTDFSVTLWGEDPTQFKTVKFEDRPEGRFEIPGSPIGATRIIASSNDLPACTPRLVEVSQDGTAEVVLELPGTVSAGARVVEAATGEPIGGAVVQAYQEHRGQWLEPWGPALETRADGSFDGLLLSPVTNAIKVSAEGYAAHSSIHSSLQGAQVELGLLTLDRLQEVEVLLVGDGIDFTQYSASIDATPAAGPVPFDMEGRALLARVPPGSWMASVFTPGPGLIQSEMRVRAGRPARWQVDLAGGHQLHVRITHADGPLPSDAWLVADFSGAAGPTARLVGIANGRATVPGLPAGAVCLSVIQSNNERLGSFWYEVPDQLQAEVAFHIPAGRRAVQLVDLEGRPMDSVLVIIARPGDPHGLNLTRTTDAQGTFNLLGIDPQPLLLTVRRGRDSWGGVHPIDMNSQEDPLVVVVDESAQLSVRLLERDQPAVGVGALLYDGEQAALKTTSDGAGQVHFGRIAPGDYSLVIEAAGYVRSGAPFSTRVEASELTLQVRRTGNLRLHASRGGLSLSGARLELTYGELPELLLAWAEDNGIDLSQLLTDSTGNINLTGLPNGKYHWQLMSGTALVEGNANVPALGKVQVQAVFPE
jgi:hypothetical protein